MVHVARRLWNPARQRDSIGHGAAKHIGSKSCAHQPMPNFDKSVWIVYNGEVYNFASERRILERLGYRFRSNSDTEVVLRMYEHYVTTFC